MVNLNRNNSNWSFEERRKINENWAILEGLANSTASGNNGLKSEVDQLKITVGQNTNRVTNSIQLSNQANVKSDSALTLANTALSNSNEAKNLAGIADGKANQAILKSDNAFSTANEAISKLNSAVSTANEANLKSNNAVLTANEANGKSDNAVLTANEANLKSEYVQSQLDNVVANGDSSAEVVQARNGKTTLRERLDDEYDAVTSRLDLIETNPSFKTTAEAEQPTLDQELIGASGFTSVGWTGDYATGFTHVPGQTSPLLYNIPSLTGEIYLVTIIATNLEPTGNAGTSDFYVSLGGSTQFETYKGTHDQFTFTFGIRALTANKDLVITPRAEWDGAILNVSVKKLLSGSIPSMSILNTDLNSVFELRNTKSLVRNVDINSIFIGKDSGKYNVDGDENYAFGNYALSSNTTGFWNQAFGQNTLRDNTVGSRNVAIGRLALVENVSGDRNVSVGTFSLSRNKTGRNNVAVGADALFKNIDGNENIALGTLALAENANGSRNFAAGYDALGISPNTGDDNIAIGRDTARSTTGDNNIALGNSSMYRNTTGSDNVALGRNTFLRSSEGNYNIAVGRGAIAENRDSEHNVALGFAALGGGQAGKNNVAIGANTLYESETDNNIAIGQNALNLNQASFDNTAIGQNALRGITAGDGNVAIGSGAMGKTNGSKTLRNNQRNVVIGKNAGVNLDNGGHFNTIVGSASGLTLQTGVSNILIGYNVDVTAADTSNSLNIGNAIKGNLQTGLIELKNLRLTNLQTTLPTVPGIVWNDSGVLKIS